MNNTINHLLSQVLAINKKYENILEITGENFNIFKILKLHTAENRTHSAFIAELLNPKGSHGQKDAFLKLFIKTVLPQEFSFETVQAKVVVEKHIGFTNLEKTEGGRLDICITDHKYQEIFIENKIYAGDQENQLLRYFNQNNYALLLYLCLDDKQVSELSCGNLIQGKHFHVITYKRDIINWLNECKKESVSHPMLRESIAQYINLIKYLTDQTINEDMNKEIINQLTKDEESLDAAFKVYYGVEATCDKITKDLKMICEEIAKKHSLLLSFNFNVEKNYTGIYFYKADSNTGSIAFQFQHFDKNLIYGFIRKKNITNLKEESTNVIFERLAILNGERSVWWHFQKPIEEPYNDWSVAKPWYNVINGSIKGCIESKVVEILTLLKDEEI